MIRRFWQIVYFLKNELLIFISNIVFYFYEEINKQISNCKNIDKQGFKIIADVYKKT